MTEKASKANATKVKIEDCPRLMAALGRQPSDDRETRVAEISAEIAESIRRHALPGDMLVSVVKIADAIRPHVTTLLACVAELEGRIAQYEKVVVGKDRCMTLQGEDIGRLLRFTTPTAAAQEGE